MSEKHPGNNLAKVIYGISLREKGMVDDAIETLKKLPSDEAGSGYTHYLVGEMLHKKFINASEGNNRKQYLAEAEKELRTAVIENSEFGSAWCELGLVYYKQDKCQEAMNAFNKYFICQAKELNELAKIRKESERENLDDNTYYSSYQAYLFYGMSAQCIKDYQRANNAFMQALSMPCADCRVYTKLVWMYIELENYDAAHNVITQAIKKYPKNIDLLKSAIYAYLGANKPIQAGWYQKRLYEVDPNTAIELDGVIKSWR